MAAKKGLICNVDFYSASVYYSMGIPIDLFTPVFATSRIAGWCAHVLEQYQNNRIYRPRGSYVGPDGRGLRPDRRALSPTGDGLRARVRELPLRRRACPLLLALVSARRDADLRRARAADRPAVVLGELAAGILLGPTLLGRLRAGAVRRAVPAGRRAGRRVLACSRSSRSSCSSRSRGSRSTSAACSRACAWRRRSESRGSSFRSRSASAAAYAWPVAFGAERGVEPHGPFALFIGTRARDLGAAGDREDAGRPRPVPHRLSARS